MTCRFFKTFTEEREKRVKHAMEGNRKEKQTVDELSVEEKEKF